jgi:hypothetical protein
MPANKAAWPSESVGQVLRTSNATFNGIGPGVVVHVAARGVGHANHFSIASRVDAIPSRVERKFRRRCVPRGRRRSRGSR